MALIGVTYVIIGKQTSSKLSELRKSALSEPLLRKKFAIADKSNCGSLSIEEFKHMMTAEFGIDFTTRELEVSFNHMDSVHERDGRGQYPIVCVLIYTASGCSLEMLIVSSSQ